MVNIRDIIRIDRYLWEIPTSFRPDMRVPARVYADEALWRRPWATAAWSSW